MSDEGPHPLKRDTLEWGHPEIIGIVCLYEPQPAPIGRPNHPARALRKVSARSRGLVENISWLIGGAKGLTVALRPFVNRKMLQRSHEFSLSPLSWWAPQLEGFALLKQMLPICPASSAARRS